MVLTDYAVSAPIGLIFILDIWALINILGSSKSTADKALWTLLVFFAPLIGFIVWAFVGPRSR